MERDFGTFGTTSCSIYFTDGLFDLITIIAGAGFAARGIAQSMMVINNISLQAETAAIMGALVHASGKGEHVIHTDSKTAIDYLQQGTPTDEWRLQVMLEYCNSTKSTTFPSARWYGGAIWYE